MDRKILVTGLGFITSIGNDKATVTKSLIDLQHGFEKKLLLDNPKLPVSVFGTIKGFETSSHRWMDWEYPEDYSFEASCLKSMAPHGLYALCAMLQAISNSRLSPEEISNPETGLFCASAGSPFLLRNQLNSLMGGMRSNPMGILNSISGTLNFNLGTYFKIYGANSGFVSACTSTSHALAYAYEEILSGRQKRMFVVGAEDLTAETFLPFNTMGALSRNADPDTASRPFDSSRDGFVGTGGATVMILEEKEEALKRNAPVLAEMAGWGQASDGYNLASPHPEGKGLCMAMQNSFTSSGISAAEVDYINAHATSTPTGDIAESSAIRSVFSDQGHRPFVSSTKAITGHGLSMAGVLEAAISTLAISEGFIPGAAHISDIDPVCSHLNLPQNTIQQPLNVVMSNGSGFGGTNVSLIFRRWNN